MFLSQQPNRESTIGKLTWLAQPRNHSFTFHSDLLRKKKKSKRVKHYFLTKQNLNKENRKTNTKREIERETFGLRLWVEVRSDEQKPFTYPKIKISKIAEKLDPNSFSMKNFKFVEKFPNSNVNAQTHHK